MEKIVVLDALAIPEAYPLKRPSFEHEWVEYPNSKYEDLVSRALDATIVATSKCRLDSQVLSQLPKLKHVAVMATGYNNVDVAYCKEHGIAVTNIQDYSTESVAEHTITMMLMLSRSMLKTKDTIASGAWSKSPIFFMMPGPIVDLKGATLTVIGAGAIGSRIIELAKAFGMNTLKAERKGAASVREGYTEFYKAIESADFISVNCPLTADTANLIAAEDFERVKRNLILVNNARGGVVNEEDLVEAILSGKIAGAASDVVSAEPLPENHPYNKILGNHNFILTPHQGWCSHASLVVLVQQLVDNMEAVYNGKTLRRVV